jgi:hypothetical protein
MADEEEPAEGVELPPCTPLLVFLGEGVFEREDGPVDIVASMLEAIPAGETVTLPKPDDLGSIPEKIAEMVEQRRGEADQEGLSECPMQILFTGFAEEDAMELAQQQPIDFILGFSGLSLVQKEEEQTEEVRIGPGAAVLRLHEWADTQGGRVRTLILSDAHSYDGSAAFDGILPHFKKQEAHIKSHKDYTAATKVTEIPALAPTPGAANSSFYRRLMGSVDPEHHTLPLFLHCLTHQVELNLTSMPQESYGDVEAEIDALIGVCEDEGEVWSSASQSANKTHILPSKDLVLRNASDVQGRAVDMVGRVSCVDAGHDVYAATSVPGYKRRGLDTEVQATHERAAAQNSIYPFMPGIKPDQVERLLLLREFEDLTNSVCPERKADYSSHYFSEEVEPRLLVQAMEPEEAFLATRYYKRLDALLIVMYHRCPPGRILWHSWAQDKIWTLPGVLDHATRIGDAKPPLGEAYDLDTQSYGYMRIIEKSVIPGDAGVILCWTAERGVAPYDVGLTHLEEYRAKPRHSAKNTRVLKDGLVFGMAKDETWEKRRPALLAAHRGRQKAREKPAAAPAADDEAKGDEEDEGEKAEDEEQQDKEDSESDNEEEKRFLHTQTFGVFWLRFPDGGRVSVSMDHFRQVRDDDEVLGDLGVRFSYITTTGRQVLVLSDGSVVQTDGAAPISEDGALFGQPVPGGRDDIELSRTVTQGGAVTRVLISGRREIFHHDGTYCWRNPLVEELAKRVETAQGGIRERLEQIQKKYSAPKKKPTKEELVRGLPGHWIVVHRSGRRTGRMDPLDVGDAAEQWKKWLTDVSVLQDGVWEYDLPAASAQHFTNPHTGQQVFTSEYSVQYTEEETKEQHVALFGDATKIVWRKTEEGMDISVESPDRLPVMVRREVDAYVPKAKLKIFCPAGVVLEVIPQEMNEKGELIPADIRAPDKVVFNAAVLVRHPDGHLVKSVGTGAVDVFPRSEVRRKGGEREALRSVEKDGIYTAKCFEDLLVTIDTEGNNFDITSSTADAKLAVSISGEDALASPRCERSHTPYFHPDVSFLPLPQNFPEPRLLVVHGDGRAEELVSYDRAQDILNSASAEPRNHVEVTELQPPSRGLRVHTLYMPSEETPRPSFAEDKTRPSQNGSTQVRHLEEFPPVTSDVWAEFREAYDRYRTWSADHADAHAKMGQELPHQGRRP